MKNVALGLNTLKNLAKNKGINTPKYAELVGYKKVECKSVKLFDAVLAFDGSFTDETATMFVAEMKSELLFSNKKQLIHTLAYFLSKVKKYEMTV